MSKFLALFPLFAIALGCASQEPVDSGDGDGDGDGDGAMALESGVFAVRDAELSQNSCGANLAMFFPLRMTLTASDAGIMFEELDALATQTGSAFALDTTTTISYRGDRLACSLDFRTGFSGTVLASDAAEVELNARVATTPGAPSDDCEMVATELVGLSSWSELGGCRLAGHFYLESN